MKHWRKVRNRESGHSVSAHSCPEWPPAIKHAEAYTFEPELLNSAPREVVDIQKVDRETVLTGSAMAGLAWLCVTYVMLIPKKLPSHTSFNLLTSPDWNELPTVLCITSVPVVCIAIVWLTSRWLARQAVAFGTPVVAYVHRINRNWGGKSPGIVYRFQTESGSWIYAEFSADEVESAALRVGDPFTVVTSPGVHPFVYVCVYNRCGFRAA